MIPDYMFPEDGESEVDFQVRLVKDWLYARGTNHPADVARWLTEYTPAQLAKMYQETWGILADEEEFVLATAEQIASGLVDLYEDDDA